jgi:hypothetical protein
VEVIDADDQLVKNTICFGIYRYEDATLNENILMRQTDVCSEVTCKIKFNTVVSSILSPAIGATSTVNLATTTGTV